MTVPSSATATRLRSARRSIPTPIPDRHDDHREPILDSIGRRRPEWCRSPPPKGARPRLAAEGSPVTVVPAAVGVLDMSSRGDVAAVQQALSDVEVVL